jgi:hypothetical protein
VNVTETVNVADGTCANAGSAPQQVLQLLRGSSVT